MTTRKNKSARTLGELGERAFIKKLLPRLRVRSGPSFLVSPGDDSAVLKTRSRPVLSIDGLTEGTHFKSSWAARVQKLGGFSLGRGLGWKLMGSSLSDLAAMGDTAHRWAMVYLGAPGSTPLPFLKELQTGVAEAARRHDCALAGGDTVKANELSLVAAVGGELSGPRALTRSGGKPGDVVCVAGTVGDAFAGLQLLLGTSRAASNADAAFLVRRFFDHRPLFNEGAVLSREKGVTSLIDLSDAFLDSIEILCRMSGVGATIGIDSFPVSAAYRRAFGIDMRLLTGGEDYSLLFTARPSALPRLRRKMKFSAVGRLESASNGISFFLKGRRVSPPRPFQHFS